MGTDFPHNLRAAGLAFVFLPALMGCLTDDSGSDQLSQINASALLQEVQQALEGKLSQCTLKTSGERTESRLIAIVKLAKPSDIAFVTEHGYSNYELTLRSTDGGRTHPNVFVKVRNGHCVSFNVGTLIVD